MDKPVSSSEVVQPTVERFLKTVLRSGLLDREQLQASLRGMPAEGRDDPDAVADHLVKTGKLSRFQARKLLKGTAVGLLLGPFQILAPIGKGGMGTVYLARDSRSDQLLALKVLPPRKAREEERMLVRFRREMEMCQRVAHPHIAWTLDVGVCQGVYYIAMEYIPGKSLYRLVAEDGPLPVPRAARLFAEVSSALEHAHAQGLIHRDLKPSNILVTPNDHAKLLDMGLALVQGETAAAREVIGGHGYIVGTMDYIAPEQAADAARVDPRSDIYALGCTLYYAVTGRPPFSGGSTVEKLQRHRDETPIPVNEINPAVTPGFGRLVARMMAKKPDERFLSAAELREELQPWTAGETVRPLDKPGDTQFVQAVALLEAAEPASDELGDANAEIAVAQPAEEQVPVAEVVLLSEQLPVGKLVSVTPSKKRLQPGPSAYSRARASESSLPSGWIYFVLISLGIVFLAAVLYIVLGR
jgi:serine/threonine protein kinase